uniref:Cytochrome c oxidase subunit 3 n=1 Tax=Aegilops tauschii TaxID=37682 RepID=N1QWF9_AEGTA
MRHSYHLVDPSPWPISGSLGALATTFGGVMYIHSFQGGATLLSLGLIFLLYTMFVWWRDVLRESMLEGHHTKKVVQLGPRYGSILVILSEVMFLFAFLGFFSFFFGTYGRDRRYHCERFIWVVGHIQEVQRIQNAAEKLKQAFVWKEQATMAKKALDDAKENFAEASNYYQQAAAEADKPLL